MAPNRRVIGTRPANQAKRRGTMKRLIVFAVIAALYCAAVPAAPVDEHVRGTILSVTPETLTVRTSSGASVSQNGLKHLTVTYQGGQQTILVPPTAQIVDLLPGTIADLSKGAYVFVDAAQNGSSLTAGLVAAGVGGLKPPF